MQVQRQVTSAIKNFVPVPLLMWPTQRQLKTLLSDRERHVECGKGGRPFERAQVCQLSCFLLWFSCWLQVNYGELWLKSTPNSYFTFRGSAPEPGIWNFGNLTGESNYVGVVKNAFKGSRLDIRWVESGCSSCHPLTSPEWSVILIWI